MGGFTFREGRLGEPFGRLSDDLGGVRLTPQISQPEPKHAANYVRHRNAPQNSHIYTSCIQLRASVSWRAAAG